MAERLVRKPKPTSSSKTVDSKALEQAIEQGVEARLEEMGIGTNSFTCYLCGKLHPKKNFYRSTDPNCKSTVTPICKSCVEQIVYQIDDRNKERHKPTPESMQRALEYLDKPWLEKVYMSSLQESANLTGKNKTDVWGTYIKNIAMPNYHTLRWRDSDIFRSAGMSNYDDRDIDNSKEIVEMYEINKRNVISALGYDPFESANDKDKPLMYSKLMGFLDESTTEDEMKLGACIEITHSFNQAERLNYVINDLQKTPKSIVDNASTIKSLEETKNKIFSSALGLAKDNGITVLHNKGNSKGANTWTGKVKELKELNLREQELNAFDIGTAAGMQQVADISAQAIFKQLDFDENDYTDMIKTQRQMIESLQKKLAVAEEEARIFKRENGDLKDYLKDKKLINSLGEVIP